MDAAIPMWVQWANVWRKRTVLMGLKFKWTLWVCGSKVEMSLKDYIDEFEIQDSKFKLLIGF